MAIAPAAPTHVNPSTAALYEAAVVGREGLLAEDGALVAYTGSRTGRSPKDKFVVRRPATEKTIDWGPVNQPLEPAAFEHLRAKVEQHLRGCETFVVDGVACADPAHALRVRVVAEKAWHALFARALFRRPKREELAGFRPDWHVLAAPELTCNAHADCTHSGVAIVLDFETRTVLIAGTHYAGEIKKAIFTACNYILPECGVFPMHCAANAGADGRVALFFGLSGTGKTTLSADPNRRLIGDDEHGWSDDGVFNIEGGCYAKTIRLSPEGEPQIWNAIRYGAVLENVPLDPATRVPDFNSTKYTENTRAAYPVEFIPGCDPSGRGGHPSNVIFLTCDAFGVLPPVSRLTTDQALYHFLQGYTAKVAGTEAGVTEPEATFSTCFALPFLPRRPTEYAALLRQRLERHKVPVWLVNTGWIGGPYGVGHRVPLSHTRAMLHAALTGELERVPSEPDPVFGMLVPKACPGVPAELLNPRKGWADSAAYDAAARKLAGMFRVNFEKRFAAQCDPAVSAAGPVG
jgi:phosphoenolpyruvate carboxykinase (ATP)